MNILDIILSVILLVGIIRGFIKGFIFEIALIGILFLGTYAAFKLSYLVQPWVLKIGGLNAQTVSLISSLLIFLLVATGIFFLAKLFEGLAKITAMGVFNKILGALFGLLKYAFVLSIMLYFFNQLDTKYNWISAEKKTESKFYYPTLRMAQTLLPVMKEVKERAENFKPVQ